MYDELQHVANLLFANERRGHTLQPTALIHEAWLKIEGRLDGVEDRKHFFAIASRAMRQVLADHARGAGRLKRGERNKRVTLHENVTESPSTGIDLVELDDLFRRLSELNSRHAQVVELRVLGGLTIAETAEVLEVSHSTVESDWFTSRAWLRRELTRVQ